MTPTDDVLRQWARKGAEARLAEIRAEAMHLGEAFPELPVGDLLEATTPPLNGRVRYMQTPEGRAAQSRRMKAAWARRRAKST